MLSSHLLVVICKTVRPTQEKNGPSKHALRESEVVQIHVFLLIVEIMNQKHAVNVLWDMEKNGVKNLVR